MSKLMDKLLSLGSLGSTTLADSDIFKERDFVKTELPILNIAFSGKVAGGFSAGLTILAGESKTFKTALSLYCLKAYLTKYKDAVGVIFDTEYGITPAYIRTFGIDPNRVIHIPVEHIEQLKFDFMKKLEGLVKGDKVFFLVDSIGMTPSKKEFDDAHDEKSVSDMTRAKALRGLLRLITIQLVTKNLPCFMVNHVYQTQEIFSKTVVGGGTAVTYSANQIFIISKSQEKATDGELEGWKFTINISKSRNVREKAKLPFTVYYDGGIQKYSGLIDIALELGAVKKPNSGWYSRVDLETGEIEAKKWRAKDTDCSDFWDSVLASKKFNIALEKYYILENTNISDEEIKSEIESATEE